jgi:hypothetical protein
MKLFIYRLLTNLQGLLTLFVTSVVSQQHCVLVRKTVRRSERETESRNATLHASTTCPIRCLERLWRVCENTGH